MMIHCLSEQLIFWNIDGDLLKRLKLRDEALMRIVHILDGLVCLIVLTEYCQKVVSIVEYSVCLASSSFA